jgi:hypothetical protein
MGADGLGGNNHAFKEGMGISLKNASVHKCARVTFVGVTQDVFNITRLGSAEFPFEACWEAGAASAAQSGIQNFLNNLFRRHFRQCLCHTRITIPGNRLINVFRVDSTSVFQYDQFLQSEKGYVIHSWNEFLRHWLLVEKPIQDSSFYEMFFNQFGHIFRFHRHINNALRIGHHDGAKGTKSVTTGLNNSYLI